MRAMLTDQELERVRPLLRVLRIIIFALVMGIFAFAGFIMVQRGNTAFSPQIKLEPLPLIALATAASSVVLAFVLPAVLLQRRSAEVVGEDVSLGKRDRVMHAAQKIQTTSIIACALLEGPALLNLLVVFQGAGGLLHLLLAIALALMMLVYFPFTEGAYVERLERILSLDE